MPTWRSCSATEAVCFVANDDRRGDARQAVAPQRRVLDHRAFADQRQELLWV
jgi:hypothetical protein